MLLTSRIIAKKEKYRISKLYVDGVYECDVIEDRDRGLKDTMTVAEIIRKKVKHQTAIPIGRYRITMKIRSATFSQKPYYKKFCDGLLPRLVGVKGFDGILIHRGEDQDSSSGCLIVGRNTIVGKVTQSQECFERLYGKLKKASDRGEDIWIEIR